MEEHAALFSGPAHAGSIAGLLAKRRTQMSGAWLSHQNQGAGDAGFLILPLCTNPACSKLPTAKPSGQEFRECH